MLTELGRWRRVGGELGEELGGGGGGRGGGGRGGGGGGGELVENSSDKI